MNGARGAVTLAASNDQADVVRHADAVRTAEALLFASAAPLDREAIASRMPGSADVDAVLRDLERLYAGRGVNLVRVAGGWSFRTAPDLAHVISAEAPQPQKLSRAALEVMAIVAYHQPTTRAEIEEIRGVSTSKGTLDALLDLRWIRMRGRRKTPGRPVTYGTTPAFLEHFGLEAISDLPGLDELAGIGLLAGQAPRGFSVPAPSDADDLTETEEPLGSDLMALGPVIEPSAE